MYITSATNSYIVVNWRQATSGASTQLNTAMNERPWEISTISSTERSYIGVYVMLQSEPEKAGKPTFVKV